MCLPPVPGAPPVGATVAPAWVASRGHTLRQSSVGARKCSMSAASWRQWTVPVAPCQRKGVTWVMGSARPARCSAARKSRRRGCTNRPWPRAGTTRRPVVCRCSIRVEVFSGISSRRRAAWTTSRSRACRIVVLCGSARKSSHATCSSSTRTSSRLRCATRWAWMMSRYRSRLPRGRMGQERWHRTTPRVRPWRGVCNLLGHLPLIVLP